MEEMIECPACAVKVSIVDGLLGRHQKPYDPRIICRCAGMSILTQKDGTRSVGEPIVIVGKRYRVLVPGGSEIMTATRPGVVGSVNAFFDEEWWSSEEHILERIDL